MLVQLPAAAAVAVVVAKYDASYLWYFEILLFSTYYTVSASAALRPPGVKLYTSPNAAISKLKK